MYLIGGSMHGKEYNCSQMYRLDLTTLNWDLVKTRGANAPVGCMDEHTACLNGDQIVIFGGFLDGTRVNKVYTFDVQNFTWDVIEPATSTCPSPRAGHSGVCSNGALYIFGGKNDLNERLNEIWKFDLKTRTWRQLAQNEDADRLPCVRSGHSSVVYKDYIGIFGGIFEVTKELNDFHLYDTK